MINKDTQRNAKKEERTMAVSAGVLYEVRGDAARQMVQELEHPTEAQINSRKEISGMIKEFANIIKSKVNNK